jgi:hypothetical protein
MTDPDRLVWLSTLRKGIAWHEVAGLRTVCGRYIGKEVIDGEPVHGWLRPLGEATRLYAVVECRSCMGSAEVVEPKVVRRG